MSKYFSKKKNSAKASKNKIDRCVASFSKQCLIFIPSSLRSQHSEASLYRHNLQKMRLRRANKNRRLLLSKALSSQGDNRRAYLAALLDRGFIKKANQHAKRALIRNLEEESQLISEYQETFAFTERLLEISNRHNRSSDQKKEVEEEEKNRRFIQLVKNRRIAVVGPNAETRDPERYLNHFDTVVLPNQDCADYRHETAQNVVTYFNNKHIKHKWSSILKSAEKAGCVVVWRPKPTARGLTDFHFDEMTERGIRLARTPYVHYITGSPNALPVMLYDLTFSRPKELKIFGFDFFAGEKYASNSYLDNCAVHSDIKRKFASAMAHDPFTNYNFVRLMWNTGAFEVDDYTHGYLKITREEYSKLLEKRVAEL